MRAVAQATDLQRCSSNDIRGTHAVEPCSVMHPIYGSVSSRCGGLLPKAYPGRSCDFTADCVYFQAQDSSIPSGVILCRNLHPLDPCLKPKPLPAANTSGAEPGDEPFVQPLTNCRNAP